jgi:quercetin dioxygenase-like cupin family protein
MYVRDAESMPWEVAHSAGVSYKSLRFDRGSKAGAVMIHMTPGTTYPRHKVHEGQDIFVVDGELIVGESRVSRGQYAWVAAGAESEPRTEKGCVLFVTFPGQVEHLHAPISFEI